MSRISWSEYKETFMGFFLMWIKFPVPKITYILDLTKRRNDNGEGGEEVF